MSASRWPRALRPIRSFVDPGTYLHVLRLLHYYSYSHVQPRRRMTLADGARIAPNVSIANGERISIGAGTKVGERCHLWAGDSSGRIAIGDYCRLAPGVFVTASDYRFEPGVRFLNQSRNEQDVVIGDDVWLGAGVFVAAGVTIGDGCIVGAGSVVTRSLPPNSIAVGVPARVVRERGDEQQPTPGTEAQVGR